MNILLKFLYLFVYLPNIRSACVIQYPSDADTAPKYEKYVGSYKLQIPFNSNSIELYEDEKIEGVCETYFSPIEYERKSSIDYYDRYDTWESFSNLSSIVLQCFSGNLVYNQRDLLPQAFSCTDLSYNIYSARHPYSWCKSNQNSDTFLMATQPKLDKYLLAAVCYNMDQISLQTLVYNTTTWQRSYLKQSTISSEDLGEDIQNFKTTMLSDLSEERLQETLSKLSKTDGWLALANYEISTIVQDELLKKYFSEFKNILNIVWWHNLRVGNWRRFQNTLQNHARNNSYELYLGTSGIVHYPTDDKCVKERLLELKLGFKNETIPAYIWTYLKSYDNLNKEFVIVGYNSPYTEYFGLEKIIFCPDICSEIPWLNEVSQSFRYVNAGIMFCCSTDFIRQTNYLQGFPMEVLKAPTIEQVVVTTTSEALEFNTNINLINID